MPGWDTPEANVVIKTAFWMWFEMGVHFQESDTDYDVFIKPIEKQFQEDSYLGIWLENYNNKGRNVIELADGADATTFAHELGHGLGLQHLDLSGIQECGVMTSWHCGDFQHLTNGDIWMFDQTADTP